MLAELLRARAGATPDETALIVADGGALSYASWERRSDAAASGLRGRGVGPGDRVVLVFDVADFVGLAVAAAAVQKRGAVMVPVPGHASVVELDRVARHAGAVARLDAGALTEVEGEGGRQLASQPPSTAPPGPGPVEVSYRLRPLAAARPTARAAGDVLASLDALDDGARVTSMLHASAVGTDAARWALWFPLRPGRGPVVIVPGADPERICALSAAHRVSRWALDPLVAALVLDTRAAAGHDLSALAQVVLTGGPAPPGLPTELAAHLPGTSIQVLDSDVDGQPEAPSAPVAASQEGMLWQEQLVPGSQNLPPLARRYRGPLDLDVLGRALTEIVRRHEPLRTTFALQRREAVQVVAPAGPVAMEVRDIASLVPAEQADEVDRFLAAARRPFDLVEGPLFEPTVFRLGADDHVIVFRVHHSVYDDWSVGVFRRELSALYTAFARGEPSPLPDLSLTFADFARAQRQRLAGEAGRRELEWWRRHLAGAPLALQLPVADPALPAGAPQASAEPVWTTLPGPVHAQLQALARRERATVFTTALAAVSALVGRCTGETELLLASVVANRNRVELEGMVGCFTKKVLLRVDLSGAPTFAELVARARAALLGALSHQDLPFEAVLQGVLGPEAAASGLVPQAAVMFQGVTPAAGDVTLPGLTSEGYDTSSTTRRAHFAAAGEPEGGPGEATPWGGGVYLGTFLILSVVEDGDDLSFVARGAFWRPAVERLLDDLAALLTDAVAHPARPVPALAGPAACRTQSPAASRTQGPAAAPARLRGFTVDRSRIEAVLARHPAVRHVSVTIEETEPGDAHLVAHVVPAGGEPPTLAGLRVHLWRALPGYAWPRALVLAGGGREGEAPQAGAGSSAPHAELLARAWADTLGIDEVPPDANYWQRFSFLDAVARVREAGIRLGDAQVARNRTIVGLATDVAAERARSRGDGKG